MPVRTVLLALCGVALVAGCTSGAAEQVPTSASTPSVPVTPASSPVAPTLSSQPPKPHHDPKPTHRPAATPTATPTKTPTPTATRTTRVARAATLPVGYATGTARQVITVVAGSESDTQATLQAWRRVTGGWYQVGPAVPAWLGSAGMTPHPSEQLSATPMGSFSLTDAFGHDPDPGTALHYVQTEPSYWWISQPGALYNTMQHCAGACPFTQGSPNEHLFYETPYYNYAVVIDYNRDPVQQNAGSAFFLHVSVGAPTAGCVSIDEGRLVRILRWLDPRQHPRIMIGTG
jgi:L,D-peptidoglycan transpeptidase YkuD (ErfK/YbiS/YcfS/YnhG family)